LRLSDTALVPRWSSDAHAFVISAPQIVGLETDALHQDDFADQLANTGKNGKGKNDGITKVMDAFGTAAGLKPRLDA